jgi:hypothetical protein
MLHKLSSNVALQAGGEVVDVAGHAPCAMTTHGLAGRLNCRCSATLQAADRGAACQAGHGVASTLRQPVSQDESPVVLLKESLSENRHC